VERHRLMHDLVAGSRLVVVEEAGHMPTLEQPDEVTAWFERWLTD
jgi:pimeloyl-ACP methyl ester carboxylesterase